MEANFWSRVASVPGQELVGSAQKRGLPAQVIRPLTLLGLVMVYLRANVAPKDHPNKIMLLGKVSSKIFWIPSHLLAGI